jgi:8-oxo-dGTP diphosphatase
VTSEATSQPASAVPVAAFDLALPRKRMASTVLLFDDLDRVLVVEPTYVDVMELPGGAVDLDESPRQAAIREVKDELGLDRSPGRLSAMD